MISFLRYIYVNSFRTPRSRELIGYFLIVLVIVGIGYIAAVTYYLIGAVNSGANIRVFGIEVSRAAAVPRPDLKGYTISNSFQRLNAANVAQCKSSVSTGLSALNYADVNDDNENSVFGRIRLEKDTGLMSVRCLEVQGELYYHASAVYSNASTSLKMVNDLSAVLSTKTLTAKPGPGSLYSSYYYRDFFVSSTAHEGGCGALVKIVRDKISEIPKNSYENSVTYRYLYDRFASQYDCLEIDGNFILYSLYMSFEEDAAKNARNSVRNAMSEYDPWINSGLEGISEIPIEVSGLLPDATLDDCQNYFRDRAAALEFDLTDFTEWLGWSRSADGRNVLVSVCRIIEDRLEPGAIVLSALGGQALLNLQSRLTAAFE